MLNTSKWLNSPAYATTTAKFIPNTLKKSTYQGKLYGLPCIIGGTVMLLQQGPARQGRRDEDPDEHDRARRRGSQGQRLRRTSGASTSRMTDKDFTWYFHYHDIHNRGGDIISKDGKRVTFTIARGHRGNAGLGRPDPEAQGAAAGRAVRPRGAAWRCSRRGRIAFLQDEPLRLAVVPEREASRSSGTSSTRSEQPESARSSRPPVTG